MKDLGAILIGGLAVLVFLIVGTYILLPEYTPSQPAFVISIDENLAPIHAELASIEATPQAQLSTLNQTLQQRQNELETQSQAWEAEIRQLQAHLDTLESTRSSLQVEVTQLEITHTLKLKDYQTQVAVIRQTYEEVIDRLQNELNDKQAQLDALKGQVQR